MQSEALPETQSEEGTSEALARELESRRAAHDEALARLADLAKKRAAAMKACAADMESVEKRETLAKLDAEIARLSTDLELLEMRVADAEIAHRNAVRAEQTAELKRLREKADPQRALKQLNLEYIRPLLNAIALIAGARDAMRAICSEQRRDAIRAAEVAKELGDVPGVWAIDPEVVRVSGNRIAAGAIEQQPDGLSVLELITPIYEPSPYAANHYRQLHPLLKDEQQYVEAARYLSLMRGD